MARAVAYMRFSDVVTSHPCLAMHPEGSECIETSLVAIDPMLRSG
jgi:hypothetical protein